MHRKLVLIRLSFVSMRLLCTGDIHIGRRTSGCDGREFSCGEAWVRIATLAAGQEVDGLTIPRVDAVLVSGDLTDADNRYYQAAGPVERGLKILQEAGIPTVVVSGNHDHDTMVDLHRAFGEQYDFRFLGAGGQWESTVLHDRLRVFGWSYPKQHHPHPPLMDLRMPRSDLPTVGMAHVEASPMSDAYAFARPKDFAAHPSVDFWVTGHIHRPSLVANVVNPGSPQAMDFGEPGMHGFYVAMIEGPQPSFEFVPLSTARFETHAVDLGDEVITERDRIRLALHRKVSEVRESIREDHRTCRQLFLRLVPKGMTSLSREVLAAEGKAICESEELGAATLEVAVQRVQFANLRPRANLELLAQEIGPIGVVSRALIELEEQRPGPLANRLMQAVRSVADASYFQDAASFPIPDHEELAAAAREQGYRMLEALEGQRRIVEQLL